jgi:glycosyltransferase involved in cell wall biosynthesis
MPGESRPVILFVNHWARRLGGAEYSLLDVLAYMAPRCQAHLLTSEQGALTRQASALGVTCHYVPCRLKPNGMGRKGLFAAFFFNLPEYGSFLGFVIRASALLRRLSPQCVHANVPKSHVTLFLLAAMGYRGPCWFHMREIFKKGSTPYRLYQLLFPRKTGRCIAISHAVGSRMPPAMREKCLVIHNGVAIPPVMMAADKRRELRFVYLGRVVPWKGCHRLIGMFADAKKKYPAIKLTIVGDTLYWPEDYRGRLEGQIKDLSLKESCFLLPHTQNPFRELGNHHVFCNASFEEPFGRSIAEAQAAGMPVVAFDGGAVGEIVISGTTGFLAPYGDETAFIHAMGTFIENPALVAAMGKAGRQRAALFFNRDIQIPLIGETILSSPAVSP